MPPKPTVSRDDILNAAIGLIREHGSDSVHARSIAGALGCSTKPLFRVYDNMEKLKQDVYSRAFVYYDSFLKSNEINKNDVFLSVGKNYIQLANKEKELFKYIFLSNNLRFGSLDDLANSPDTHNLIEYLVSSTMLSRKAAKDLFIELWLLVHGVATLLATNQCALDEQEIDHLLKSAFIAKYRYLKSEELSQ